MSRVLLVVGSATGGMGGHVAELARGLSERGHEVKVFTTGTTARRFGFDAQVCAAWPDVWALRRLIRTADVVHAHGHQAGLLTVLTAASVRRSGRPPVIVTWHNAVLGGGPRRRVLGWAERVQARRADLVTGASSDLVDRARELGAGSAELTEVASAATGLSGVASGSTDGGAFDGVLGGESDSTLGGALGSTTGSTTGGVLGSTTGGALGGTTGGVLGSTTGGVLGSTTGGAPGITTGGVLGSTTGEAPDSTTGGALGSTTGSALGGTTGSALGGTTGAASGGAPADTPREKSSDTPGEEADFGAEARLADGAGADRSVRTVLTVARIAPQKRLDVLIEAAALLAADAPDARWLVAGDGDAALQADLEGHRDALGAPVTFLGRRDDVPALMAAASVFALASDWEARALVVQEAMAAGLPVVVTAVGGLPDLLGAGAPAGLLVPPGDARALATAVGRVLADPLLAAGLAEAGRERFRALPTSENVLEAWLLRYSRLQPSFTRRGNRRNGR